MKSVTTFVFGSPLRLRPSPTSCTQTISLPRVWRLSRAPATSASHLHYKYRHCSLDRCIDHPPGSAAPHSSAGRVDAPTTSAQELEADVVRAVAPTKRGRRASLEQRRAILAKVEALEACNQTHNPALSPLINGRWSLLYTGPTDLDELSAEKDRDSSLEGPFLARLRPFFGWLLRTKGIVQIIDTAEGDVQNLAEFVLLGIISGYLNIVGIVAPAAAGTRIANETTRVDVEFTAFKVKLGLLVLSIPFSLFKKRPQGWVETTYINDQMRIGRGDKGSVFVTVRQTQ